MAVVAVRQVAPGALVNRRGGRGAGVAVHERPPGWRMPALPKVITAKVDAGVGKLRERLGRLEAEREELRAEKLALELAGELDPAINRELRALNARIDVLEDRIAKMEELALHQPAAIRHAREVWREWWESTPSHGVLWESDRELLTWWIVQVYQRAMYVPIAIARPTVSGSTGQEVENPLFGTIAKATRDIEHVAKAFGMDTTARFRLAFQGVRAQGDDEDDDDGLDDSYGALLGESP